MNNAASKYKLLITVLEKWSYRPWYGMLLTVLGVLTGLCGSLFSDDIKSAFPFYWGKGDISYVSFMFWTLLAVFSFLFYFRHSAAHESQNILVKQSERLENLIRTLPPEGFLTEFAKISNLCHQAAKEVILSNDRDSTEAINNIELAIRVVLDGVVALAYTFDGKPHGARYSANIMVYRSVKSLNDDVISDIKSRIQFIEDGVGLKELDGILDLNPSLSTTTDSQDPLPDTDLRNFALPIPVSHYSDDGKRFRILPGAPMAFGLTKMSIYPDTRKLSKWCRDNGDFSPSLCSRIDSYFTSPQAEKIKSFASMPIVNYADDCNIGVLNIHRDQIGLLEEKESVKQFFPLMQPILSLLVELISMLNEDT